MKVQSIFIVSHFKEVQTRRLHVFLDNLLKTELNGIKIYLFMSDNITKDDLNELIEITASLNLEILIYENSKSLNHLMFVKVFNFKVLEYQTILILESDCSMDKQFLNKINDDLISYNNIWIYGSYYYGTINWAKNNFTNRIHMNGVAVYNRTKEFCSVINSININSRINYDCLLTYKLIKNNIFLNKVVDSKFILNLSPKQDSDISFDYKNIKENTCILHTKNDELLSKCLDE